MSVKAFWERSVEKNHPECEWSPPTACDPSWIRKRKRAEHKCSSRHLSWLKTQCDQLPRALVTSTSVPWRLWAGISPSFLKSLCIFCHNNQKSNSFNDQCHTVSDYKVYQDEYLKQIPGPYHIPIKGKSPWSCLENYILSQTKDYLASVVSFTKI